MSQPVSDWDPLPPDHFEASQLKPKPAANAGMAERGPGAATPERFAVQRPGGAEQPQVRRRNRDQVNDELAELMGKPIAKNGRRLPAARFTPPPVAAPPVAVSPVAAPPQVSPAIAAPATSAPPVMAAVAVPVTPTPEVLLPMPAPLVPVTDVREEQVWFQALPPAERERLRAQWHFEGTRGESRKQRLERASRAYAAKFLFSAAAILILLVSGWMPLARLGAAAVTVMIAWQFVPQRAIWLAASAVFAYASWMWPELLVGAPEQLAMAWLGVAIVGLGAYRTDLPLFIWRKLIRQ
jgi:hypothetical protein